MERAEGMASVAVVGGGPAGLMAAEVAAGAGCAVTVFDRMPSVGRKLLMAGRSGLNVTHERPGDYPAALAPMLAAFGPAQVRDWMDGLGQPWFAGSTGRVFPVAMKASPLLRAWLARLEASGVTIVRRAEWTGWDGDALAFANGARVAAGATVLAMGGASWSRLGLERRLGRAAAGRRGRFRAVQRRLPRPLVGAHGAALRRPAQERRPDRRRGGRIAAR